MSNAIEYNNHNYSNAENSTSEITQDGNNGSIFQDLSNQTNNMIGNMNNQFDETNNQMIK